MNEEKLFTVYKHIFPNNKVYIGMTMLSTKRRWGGLGNKYQKSHQPYIARAIEKYGWENVQHEIIASDLSLKDACDLEIQLIKDSNSTNPDFGYNAAVGGRYATFSDVTKLKMSKSRQGRINTDITREKCRLANVGKTMSIESRLKMSMAKKGKQTWNKGIPMSEEQKKKISESLINRSTNEKTI